MPALLKILASVKTPRVVHIAAAAVNAKNELGLPGNVIITSGNDKTHSKGSKHYSDAALDFRTRDLTAEQTQAWANNIRVRLGNDYDVVIEPTHLHIEYDPKPRT